MNEELTLEASIELLLDQVPGPVRAFVLNELSATTADLTKRHQLHVDHGGVLERELLLMLLGQSTPEEFVKDLAEAGIPAETIKNITADVNREVFLRLQTEERTSSATPVQPPASSAPAPASIPIYSPAPQPVIMPPPPRPVATPPPNLPGQLPELTVPKPIPPPAAPVTVPPPPHIEVPAPKPVATPATDPNARIIHTMSRDMQAVKSGVDPYRVAHPAPPAWAEAPAAAPAPRPLPPPVPTPPVATPAPAPEKPLPAPTPLPHEPLRAHLKQYGVDPYREPVE